MVLQKIKSIFSKENEKSNNSGGITIKNTDPTQKINEVKIQSAMGMEPENSFQEQTSESLHESQETSALAIQLFDPTQSRPAAITPSGKIITQSPFDPAVKTAEQKEIPSFGTIETDKELWDAVEKVIDARIRPMIKSHQGDIELVKIENGIVTVRLTGTCVGCAMSTVTLKYGVRKDITSALPQIKDVDAVFTY